MAESVTTREGTFEIRSEAHGPHWVAWLAPAATPGGAPHQAILIVGQTQAEAEARAREWAERR